MSDIQTKRIGFVGVGRMGGPMANRLIDAGYELVIFDTNSACTDPLVARGAVRVGSPKAVADETQVVLMSLPTPAIVWEVAAGNNGLIHGKQVKIAIDLSTTGPEMAMKVADQLAKKGISGFDCPVSGGIAGAVKGTLALMASGDANSYDIVKPILANLGNLFYVGGKAGMGQTMKVINNMISVTSLAITSEALVLGAKVGLDADMMIDVINAGSGKTGASMDKMPKYVLPRTFDFGFAIGLSAKDVRLCLEAGDSMGVPMPVGRAVVDFVHAVRDQYGEQADMTEMIKRIEAAAGVEVKGKKAKTT